MNTLTLNLATFFLIFTMLLLLKNTFFNFIFQAIKYPFVTFITGYLIYSCGMLLKILVPDLFSPKIDMIINYASDLFSIFILIWVIFNILKVVKSFLLEISIKSKHTTIAAILPSINNSLYAIIIFMGLNFCIAELGLSAGPGLMLEKASKVFFIGMLGWIFVQVVHALEQYFFNQYLTNENINPFSVRKLKTQVLILKRVILSIGLTVTVATILMMFDSVRNLGAGILTTAGILSAIGAFASQQSLSRLFAGIQLAFTQPIRIGDTIIIDSEFGQVEEINLSYVVIKLWDLRRLIKPTDYFTTQGLQNLTRDSTQLLGTIFLYADYTLPVDDLRNKFFALLDNSTLWDKKIRSLDVTDITEKSMEIRALMSAENASTLWSLRCFIREELMKYLVEHYPQCLTQTRSVSLPQDSLEKETAS